jgi:hypothetical protein
MEEFVHSHRLAGAGPCGGCQCRLTAPGRGEGVWVDGSDDGQSKSDRVEGRYTSTERP